jgi:hypothetical protein
MRQKETPKVYDLMIILSGPEPQRTYLDEKLQKEVVQILKAKLFLYKVL